MLITITGECQFKDCEEDATHMVAPSYSEIKLYCAPHTVAWEDQKEAEYIARCPNCYCMFGVN
jgi:hypothetical protein